MEKLLAQKLVSRFSMRIRQDMKKMLKILKKINYLQESIAMRYINYYGNKIIEKYWKF